MRFPRATNETLGRTDPPPAPSEGSEETPMRRVPLRESTPADGAFLPCLLIASALSGLGCQLGPNTGERELSPVSVGPVERTAPFGDGVVAYSDTGQREADGPRSHDSVRTTLALVHGWASDRRVWQRQIEAMAGDFRLLAIDLPGHGASSPPSSGPDSDSKGRTHGYSMDMLARSVIAVLDDARVERAVLVGHSNGAPVIRQVYRLFPERTSALVVVDGALRQMIDQDMVAGLMAQLEPETYRDFVAAMIDGMKTPGLDPRTFDEIRTMTSDASHGAVVGNFLAATEPSIWQPDPIDVPLLAILAKQPSWDADYEAFVRGLQPEVDYIVLDDVSHFLMMERPDDFHRVLREFLARNELL